MLSKTKQEKLIEHFVTGTTARIAADILSVNQKTAAYYHHRLREIIVMKLTEDAAVILSGGIEIDEY